MTTLNAGLTEDSNNDFYANLTGANANATRSSQAQADLKRSLMSPEEMKQMREEAKLAISRGASALSDMGKVGGLEAPDWQTLQHMLGSQQYQIGDIKSNPVVNLTGMADAANAKTLQNRAMGLAQTDKVNPLTAALEKQGEDTYSTGSMMQNLWRPDLIPAQTAATAGAAGTAANILNENARTQEALGRSNQPSAVNLSTPGATIKTQMASQYAPAPDVNKLPETVQSYGKQYNDMFDPNQSVANLTQNAAKNRATVEKITNEYSASGNRNPNNVRNMYDNFTTGVAPLINDGLINQLNTAVKSTGLSKDQIGEMVSNGSLWTDLGKKLGTSSEAGMLLSKVTPVLQTLPDRYQVNVANQLANGTIDKKGLMATVDQAVNDSTAEYYKKNALSVISQGNSRITSGQVPVENIQNKLNDSYALNSPSLMLTTTKKEPNGKTVTKQVTAADSVMGVLRDNAEKARQEGWSEDRKTAEDLRAIKAIDAMAKKQAEEQSNVKTTPSPTVPPASGRVSTIIPPKHVITSKLSDRGE